MNKQLNILWIEYDENNNIKIDLSKEQLEEITKRYIEYNKTYLETSDDRINEILKTEIIKEIRDQKIDELLK